MTTSTRSAIAVFTGKSLEHVLQDGGSQSWVLDRNNARRCTYLVCCRSGVEWVEGHEPRGSAFLVGRVEEVVPSTEDPGRWLIRISAYAKVSFPDVWKGWRNPVRYTDLDALGIDVKSLRFQPMPEKGEEPRTKPAGAVATQGLTIAEAKLGLAKTFGVSEDAVEITIRG
jgi:hypothetical protein